MGLTTAIAFPMYASPALAQVYNMPDAEISGLARRYRKRGVVIQETFFAEKVYILHHCIFLATVHGDLWMKMVEFELEPPKDL